MENLVLKKKKTSSVIKKSISADDAGLEQEPVVKKQKIKEYEPEKEEKEATEEVMVLPGEVVESMVSNKTPVSTKRYTGLGTTNKQEGKPKQPLEASATRQTCRYDYAKDICKDYFESGYCVFGDTCIFLHDRSDYSTGWEVELEWREHLKRKENKVVEEEDVDNSKCFVCKEEFKKPVKAECGHQFCESCALDEFKKNAACPVCKKQWKGNFKSV